MNVINRTLILFCTSILLFSSCKKDTHPAHLPEYDPVPQKKSQWTKLFDLAGNTKLANVLRTNDGGYIAAGMTRGQDVDGVKNHGGFDILIIKVDSAGNKVWSRIFGGANDEEVDGFTATSDGGYAVAGISKSNDGDFSQATSHGSVNHPEAYILRLDKNGNLTWARQYGGGISAMAANIIAMQDGGFTIAGNMAVPDLDFAAWAATPHASSNFFMLKTDASGAISSIKLYGGTGTGYITSLAATQDQGVILAGQYNGAADFDFANTTPHGATDLFLINTDVAGNVRWARLYGGKQPDGATHVIATPDGGYALLGVSSSPEDNSFVFPINGSSDPFLMKTDASGQMLWATRLGGSAYYEILQDVIVTPDGGYAVCGATPSSDGDLAGATAHGADDAWISKLDQKGIVQWSKLYGGTGLEDAFSLVNAPDGGLVIAALSRSTDSSFTVAGTQNNGLLFKINY